jgi:hypothetical protein
MDEKLLKVEKASKEWEDLSRDVVNQRDSARAEVVSWETRTAELVKRERQCDLNDLEMRLTREHKSDIIVLTQSIFRNTVVRETLSKDKYIPDHTDSDGCWQAGRTAETESATTETESE